MGILRPSSQTAHILTEVTDIQTHKHVLSRKTQDAYLRAKGSAVFPALTPSFLQFPGSCIRTIATPSSTCLHTQILFTLQGPKLVLPLTGPRSPSQERAGTSASSASGPGVKSPMIPFHAVNYPERDTLLSPFISYKIYPLFFHLTGAKIKTVSYD